MFDIQRFVEGEDQSVSDRWIRYGGYVYYIADGYFTDEDGSGGAIVGVGGTILYAVGGGNFDEYNPEISGSDTVIITLSGVNYADLTFYDSGTVNDVSLSGGDKSTLTVVIGDTNYSVGTDGKLTEATAPAAEVIISSSINSSVRRPDGKIITKNIPYINPNAADSDVATFMAALNSLSNNTTIAGGTVRVDKHAIS